MSYQVFLEKLKAKIKTQRDEQVEALAQGYGKDDYQKRVGVIRGYDDAVVFAQQVMRELINGEE